MGYLVTLFSALAFVLMLRRMCGRATVEQAPPDDGGEPQRSGTQFSSALRTLPADGDLVGTWTLVSFCFDMPVQHAGCELLQYLANNNRDISLTRARLSNTLSVPHFACCASCPPVASTPLLCNDPASYRRRLRQTGTGTVVCSASDGGCVCDANAKSQQTVSGQYSVSGANLTLNLDPMTVSGINSYCVIDDQLTLHELGFGSSRLFARLQIAKPLHFLPDWPVRGEV